MEQAAHPLDGVGWRPVTTVAEARARWAREKPPNVLLVCGPAFHAWSVSAHCGARAQHIADYLLGPRMAAIVDGGPVARWIFLSLPWERDDQLVPDFLDVVHLRAGAYFPAPPSQRLERVRWAARPVRWELPPADRVAAVLVLAGEQSNLRVDREAIAYRRMNAATR